MNIGRFADLLAEFALAHPGRELSTVTAIEFAEWQAERSGVTASSFPRAVEAAKRERGSK